MDGLGLRLRENIFVGDLSGGEQKRLSIALELIDDPKIIIIDEPTTSLDICTSTQCIVLLKKLAMEGRTVICTIHQPSAIIFNLFDFVYGMANGRCIYMGSSLNLVEFLNELDLQCPSSYNPADFFLEIANNDYGEINDQLCDKIINGQNSNYRKIAKNQETNYSKCDLENNYQIQPKFFEFQNEVWQLVKRNYLNNTRDKTLTMMRIYIHAILGFFIGLMYRGIGQEASHILNVYKFLFFNVFVLMFTAFSSLQTVGKAKNNCSLIKNN